MFPMAVSKLKSRVSNDAPSVSKLKDREANKLSDYRKNVAVDRAVQKLGRKINSYQSNESTSYEDLMLGVSKFKNRVEAFGVEAGTSELTTDLSAIEAGREYSRAYEDYEKEREEYINALQDMSLSSNEAKEGRDAFLEKRKPNFDKKWIP